MIFALVGLAFSFYNVGAIVLEALRPPPDPDFVAAMLFFAEGMIPIVCSLYLLAAVKRVLIEKLGTKTLIVTASVLMLFLLFMWAVLATSHANVKAILIGFLLPMLLRASSQDPVTTVNDANQRVLCYFGGMLIGLGVNDLLVKSGYIDPAAYSTDANSPLGIMSSRFFFPITCVTLLAQVLQIGHVALEFRNYFQRRRSSSVPNGIIRR